MKSLYVFFTGSRATGRRIRRQSPFASSQSSARASARAPAAPMTKPTQPRPRPKRSSRERRFRSSGNPEYVGRRGRRYDVGVAPARGRPQAATIQTMLFAAPGVAQLPAGWPWLATTQVKPWSGLVTVTRRARVHRGCPRTELPDDPRGGRARDALGDDDPLLVRGGEEAAAASGSRLRCAARARRASAAVRASVGRVGEPRHGAAFRGS